MALSEGAKNVGQEGTSGLVLGAKYYTGNGSMVDDDAILNADKFFALLHTCLRSTQARFEDERIPLAEALKKLRYLCLKAQFARTNKVILIGNGGSSAIASHIATDYSKNGGIRTIAFNDAPTLTCLGNDFGIDEIFAKQLEFYALPGDVVIIVSSSGHSGNILRAAGQAFSMGLELVTFSGMNPNNVLRQKGLLSFFVPAKDYGLVELAHLSLLHSIVSVRP